MYLYSYKKQLYIIIMNSLQAFEYIKVPLQRNIVTYITSTSFNRLVQFYFKEDIMGVLNMQEKESALQALSDVELLSLFLPEQTANYLIAEYQNIYGLVMRTSSMELC